MQGRCSRENCKYLHPPSHLKTQLEINGRNNLIQQKTAAAVLAQQVQMMLPGPSLQPVVRIFSLILSTWNVLFCLLLSDYIILEFPQIFKCWRFGHDMSLPCYNSMIINTFWYFVFHDKYTWIEGDGWVLKHPLFRMWMLFLCSSIHIWSPWFHRCVLMLGSGWLLSQHMSHRFIYLSNCSVPSVCVLVYLDCYVFCLPLSLKQGVTV